MSEWKEYKLGEIAEFSYGTMPKKELLYHGNYPIFSGYKYQYSYPLSNCNKGDVIVVARGVGGTGDVKVVSQECYLTNLSIKISLNNNIVNNWYFYYKYMQSTLRYLDSGSAQSQITIKDLSEIELELPSLAEQGRIAGILSSLDDKIDLLTCQNRTLEAMAENLFRQYFIENPKADWNDGVIADIIDFNPTRKLSKGTIAPFLEMSNLSTTTYAPNGWYDRAFSSGTKFKNGDTLLARITPCLENGKTAYVDFLKDEQVAWGSTEYIVMCPKGELHPFFAYIVAKYQDFRDYAESCMSGSSGRQRVDVDNLKGYEIKMPDSGTIKQFNVCVESIVGKMNCNNNQIRSLTKLRDTLLPKLMNNEVKIQSYD